MTVLLAKVLEPIYSARNTGSEVLQQPPVSTCINLVSHSLDVEAPLTIV